MFSIIKYKIIRADDTPAVGKESGCVRNDLKQWGTLTPRYIFLSNYFLFVWTQNVCIPSPSVPGLNLLWVAVCCCSLPQVLLAVESVSWVEHSASSWPAPVDQSGSVFELLVRACLTVFRADLIFFSYFDRHPGCCSERATALSLDCFIKSCWRSYLPSALLTLSHTRLFYSISQHLKTVCTMFSKAQTNRADTWCHCDWTELNGEERGALTDTCAAVTQSVQMSCFMSEVGCGHLGDHSGTFFICK